MQPSEYGFGTDHDGPALRGRASGISFAPFSAQMTFLNIILLAGIAGAAVPIAIHFFHRRRAQRVRWGAMELLDRTVGQNRRRMKFKQFLLLLARCLIPTLLAFAMARPVLTRNRA